MERVGPLTAVETAQLASAKRRLPSDAKPQSYTFVCALEPEFSRERRRAAVGEK